MERMYAHWEVAKGNDEGVEDISGPVCGFEWFEKDGYVCKHVPAAYSDAYSSAAVQGLHKINQIFLLMKS